MGSRLSRQLKGKPNSPWIILAVLALVVFGAFIYRRPTNMAEINYIGNLPASSATPQASAKCYPNIASINAINACSSDLVSYRQISYKCSNGTVGNYGAPSGNCLKLADMLRDTGKVCGNICEVIVPSPTPSVRPSPSLRPSPSPSIQSMFSCKVHVYQLRPEDPINRPMQFATPDREINPSSHIVKPGERYAYLIESTSNLYSTTVATVSAHTSNLHGFDEPILVQSTSPDCVSTDGQNKFLSCTLPETTYTAKVPKLLDLGMVVQIQDSIKQTQNTSTEFTVNNLYYGNYQMSKCTIMMLGEQVSPLPTPSYWTCVYNCVTKERKPIAVCREQCR